MKKAILKGIVIGPAEWPGGGLLMTAMAALVPMSTYSTPFYFRINTFFSCAVLHCPM